MYAHTLLLADFFSLAVALQAHAEKIGARLEASLAERMGERMSSEDEEDDEDNEHPDSPDEHSPYTTNEWETVPAESDDSTYIVESLVPPTFVWTDKQFHLAFQLWYWGDETRGIVPFREIDPQTFPVHHHPEYYDQPAVLAYLASRKQKRGPPANAADRAKRAKAQVTSYNEWKRMIRWMMEEDSVVETIGPEMLQWLEKEDPEGFMLPSGKRMRNKPTYTQIGELYTAGYDALTAFGIDSASAGCKRQVRPGERNVGTWERKWRKHKKKRDAELAGV